MTLNWLIIFAASLVPLLVGFIWYNPKTFGNVWMRGAGLTEESMKGANMVKIFGLTFLFSFFVAFELQFMVIHQWSLYSILESTPGRDDPSTEAGALLKTFMDNYGHNFRSFGHGSLHGTLCGIFFVMPILAINGLFERKGFKYIAINAGFWTVCLGIMGGLICQFT